MRFLKHKFTFFISLIYSIVFSQCDLPKEVPSKIYPVNDYGDFFSDREENQLNQKLIAYADSTSTEIIIVTAHSLCKEPIELAAARIGEEWKIGQKKEDNGCVILLAKEERKITIQGGYGFQTKIPATTSKYIINHEITPLFKQGQFTMGIHRGLNAIFKGLEGKYKAQPKEEDFDISAFIPFLIILIIIILIFSSRNNRNNGNRNDGGNYRRRRSLFEDIIITNSGSSNWGGGGSFESGSGGGFGGFGGGGNFGGGGASGGW